MKRYRHPISNHFETKKKKSHQSKPAKSIEKINKSISIYQHYSKHPS